MSTKIFFFFFFLIWFKHILLQKELGKVKTLTLREFSLKQIDKLSATLKSEEMSAGQSQQLAKWQLGQFKVSEMMMSMVYSGKKILGNS